MENRNDTFLKSEMEKANFGAGSCLSSVDRRSNEKLLPANHANLRE
jgi:hypothetical protein